MIQLACQGAAGGPGCLDRPFTVFDRTSAPLYCCSYEQYALKRVRRWMGSVVKHQRSALVTGAARGIGRAIAERLRADGLAVTIADLPSSAPLLVELAAALGGPEEVLSVAVDVSDPA